VYSVEAAQAIVEPGPVDSVLLEDEASELSSKPSLLATG
jgi:hypothetical protein